ncbi:MAG: low molecular weight phosphotyrosine protein phosphatase [Micrococcales bacterium]|nr:low molecular weight phosphotyrosine protein phosphatase [Micrococcales bacterium]
MTVCTGNICRSTMAEVVLRERFAAAGLGDAVTVCSRGVSDEEAGNPVDRRARAVLLAHGYPGGDGHVARQVTADELDRCDLVLAMTAGHARVLRRMAQRRGVDPPVVLYRRFDPAAPRVGERDEHRLDVDDPWYGGPPEFEVCLAQVEAGADGVVARVRAMLHDRA